VSRVFPSELPGQRWLLRQLGRFRQSLESLIGRLRGDLAQTVGRAVGDAVREAVQQIGGELRPPPVYRPPSYSSHWDRPERSRDPWGDDDSEDSWRTPDDEYEPPRRYDDEPAARDVEPAARNDALTTGSRWSTALRNGLAAGSWWLARMKKYPVAGAAVVAVATALGSYFAGPTLIASVAGVTLGLFSLADGLAAAAHALNG
jgi:hypothetical protein